MKQEATQHILAIMLMALCSTIGPAAGIALADEKLDRTVLPIPEPQVKPTSELDVRKATPPLHFQVKAPEGAPNVLVVLVDDLGFAGTSAFGGPVGTPTFDRIAGEGLYYNNFHTTAVCSPTRAALKSGRNHHVNNTVGRFTRASTSSYGFLGGETNQWAPFVYDGTHQDELPDDPNYHFMTDMKEKARAWIKYQKALTPDKPSFIYFAPGAMHAPHHVPKEWIAKWKGKFDHGWDKVREETLARQIERGIAPKGTRLAPKPEAIPD